VELGVEYPEYRRIPAIVSRGPQGVVTTRWRLTWSDIFHILVNRSVWIQIITKHEKFPAVCATAFEPNPNRIDAC
jgi:hypothetical protein